jgi:hypothetical protein
MKAIILIMLFLGVMTLGVYVLWRRKCECRIKDELYPIDDPVEDYDHNQVV